ncbi:ABC transporter ATP-binding protein [Clostridium pasteurianum]|uniref:ABC-type multidrug transport system, ATPase component n=1 Tax=Clostridium pasteurianum BC1 TaxID=86416 RepID=R4K452_CLOPA|nr:ABC transporter ATP-binding protein [Clostridium pasteurianum]AGK96481.1 ABC-type multidrug transport system, ATPase component [Clostridium pasteurianum BC1]
MDKVLEVAELTKFYKNGRGVKNISFDVYKGDVFGFLGPNGAGKTTVMKSITGLNSFQSGKIKILGYDLCTQFEAALKNVGSIIETAEVYEYISAYANLKFVSRFHKNINEANIEEALDMVNLTEYKKEKVSKFSLGMKQRLAIARALLANPKLIILDEPTNGLDIEGTVQLRNLIIELANKKKTTFFISSHLVHEIELMCNKVAIIHNGKLINNGEEIQNIKSKFNSLEDYYMRQIADGGNNNGKFES